MIGIERTAIADLPCLVIDHVRESAVPKPLFVYFHGFGSAKEFNLPLAYLLAEKGFRVLLPDALYHGERGEGVTAMQLQLGFWDTVLQNIQELPLFKAVFQERGLLKNEKVFVAGTSMGGITTAACLSAYPWIQAAAIMMGTARLQSYARLLGDNVQKMGLAVSPEELEQVYQQVLPYDLSVQLDKLQERPLLLWHGKKDAVIPYTDAERFYQEARQVYQDPTRIKLATAAEQGHKVNRPAVLEAVAWFEKYYA